MLVCSVLVLRLTDHLLLYAKAQASLQPTVPWVLSRRVAAWERLCHQDPSHLCSILERMGFTSRWRPALLKANPVGAGQGLAGGHPSYNFCLSCGGLHQLSWVCPPFRLPAQKGVFLLLLSDAGWSLRMPKLHSETLGSFTLFLKILHTSCRLVANPPRPFSSSHPPGSCTSCRPPALRVSFLTLVHRPCTSVCLFFCPQLLFLLFLNSFINET